MNLCVCFQNYFITYHLIDADQIERVRLTMNVIHKRKRINTQSNNAHHIQNIKTKILCGINIKFNQIKILILSAHNEIEKIITTKRNTHTVNKEKREKKNKLCKRNSFLFRQCHFCRERKTKDFNFRERRQAQFQ